MNKLLLAFLVLAVIFPSLNVLADDQASGELLPIGLTDEEMLRLDEIGKNFRPTAPPAGATIRNAAEWEPSQGVIIRWPLGISYALVAEMSEDLVVTTIVASSSEENTARSNYTSNGVNMDNVDFLIASTNSIWTRDYGPWFIFEDGQLAIVDHIYNRPRPLDDEIPWTLGSEWGLDVYGMNLNHTGGNHMSDGLGMSMSSELVYNENSDKTEAEVDSIMMAYLGNNYTVLGYVESGGIHHIDCWAKFLNPSTILVKDVPSGSSVYTKLNQRADSLAQQISAWGRPYTVVRVYCPSGTAYTNSIILNNKVLVPMFGSSYDDDAIETYQEAMPGYEVLGFTGSFLDDDAIHCRTMGVPDREMLFVHHVPLYGEISGPDSDYLVGVIIDPYSDSALIADSLKVIYNVDGGAWDYVMLNATAQPDSFYAYIPAQPAGSQISYYIQAADLSGRVETHPYIGAPWAHQFTVKGPQAPSAPEIVAPVDTGGFPLFDMLPTFVWTESLDPDPDDTVHYRLEISEDSLFTSVQIFDSLLTTSYTLDDSLRFADRYYWRVTAFDHTGLSAGSSEADFWTWTLGDVDNNHFTDMGDLTIMIDHLFISLDPIEPPMVADVTGDCFCDMGDLTVLIDHLFITLGDLEVGCE